MLYNTTKCTDYHCYNASQRSFFSAIFKIKNKNITKSFPVCTGRHGIGIWIANELQHLKTFLVEIQTVHRPEYRVYQSNRTPNQHRNQHIHPHADHKQSPNGADPDKSQDREHIDSAAVQEHKWFFVVDVDQNAADHEIDEGEHGDWVAKEAEEEDKDSDGGVFGAEVSKILLHSESGFEEAVWDAALLKNLFHVDQQH